MKIIAFPFAGGDRYCFNFLNNSIPKPYELHTYELPGRGVRIKEKLLSDIHAIVEDAVTWMKLLVDKDYIVYGHSMGGLIGYLALKKLRAIGWTSPLHFIVTSSAAPISRKFRDDPYHLMPKEIFYENLQSLGGCPPQIFQHVAITEFFEPILRADFKAVENYLYKEDT